MLKNGLVGDGSSPGSGLLLLQNLIELSEYDLFLVGRVVDFLSRGGRMFVAGKGRNPSEASFLR